MICMYILHVIINHMFLDACVPGKGGSVVTINDKRNRTIRMAL